MKRWALRILIVAAGAWLLAVSAVGAGQRVFRYKSEEGSYVYTTALPPQAASRGYEILNSAGQVVERVEGELSPEERAKREAEREAEQARRQAQEERLQKDRELLRMYSSPADVERAMDRRLASIDSAIETLRANILRLQAQRRNLESRAARLERTGQEVPRELFKNLEIVEAEITDLREQIEARREEKARTRESYLADKKRLRTLLSRSSRSAER